MCSGQSQKVIEYKNNVKTSLKQQIISANLENAEKTPLLSSALDSRHKHIRFLGKNIREAVRNKLFEQYQSISLDVRGAATIESKRQCPVVGKG